ncbi:MAG: hypothetical protein LVR00_07680 [Rhabdochlamydiaceae bacterium]|jgi:hypothetical protein
MQFKGYFGTTPIFDRESWLANLETAPPFDLVYGRILHEVHGSNIVSARDCSMKDCQTMFAETLPAMRVTIKNIEAASVQLPPIEKAVADIQETIHKLSKRAKSLAEAEECMKQMGNPHGFLRALANEGILFVNREENPTLLWDRFNFGKFPEQSIQTVFQGYLPDFHNTFSKGTKEYCARIHAPCPEESEVRKDFENLLATSLRLARNVEPRNREIHVKAPYY